LSSTIPSIFNFYIKKHLQKQSNAVTLVRDIESFESICAVGLKFDPDLRALRSVRIPRSTSRPIYFPFAALLK